ncbi:hypothetical protein ACY2DA_01640 [Staphylococcus simulans]
MLFDKTDFEEHLFDLLMHAYSTKTVSKMIDDSDINLKDEAVCLKLIDKKLKEAERDIIELCLKHQLSPPYFKFPSIQTNAYLETFILYNTFKRRSLFIRSYLFKSL